jgi:hypothetical protein
MANTYLMRVPMAVPLGMQYSAMLVVPLPWGTPAFLGAVGTMVATGEPAMSVAMESPIGWARLPAGMSDFQLESLYLRRFSADQRIAIGTHAFAEVLEGEDPPDAIVQTDSGPLGVESTALTLPGNGLRGVHSLFNRLRLNLGTLNPVAFTKLAGHVVYIWFEQDDVPAAGRPPKKSDQETLDALAYALAAYEPRIEELRAVGDRIPEQAPELPLDEVGGAKFYAMPLLGAAPTSGMFMMAGFEIGLAYSALFTAKDAWAELQRRVTQHDKPGVEQLLITAGGPDKNGIIYTAEEVLAVFALDNPDAISPTEHIKSVVLHCWGTGQATQLYPTIAPVFSGPYTGYEPPHHPLVPPATPAASSETSTSE